MLHQPGAAPVALTVPEYTTLPPRARSDGLAATKKPLRRAGPTMLRPFYGPKPAISGYFGLYWDQMTTRGRAPLPAR